MGRADLSETVARAMHDAYEQAALSHGWETQPRSRVAWEALPEANRLTMLAASAVAIRVVLTEAQRAIREMEPEYYWDDGKVRALAVLAALVPPPLV